MTDYVERRDVSWRDSDRFTLRAGDTFSGSIRSSNDSDTIALQLDGGTPYRIEVEADRGDGASGRLLRESVGDYIAALEVDADGVGQRVVQFDEPTTIYLAIDLTGWWGVGDYTVSLKENDDFFHGTTGQIAEELATGYWRDTGQRPAHWDLGDENVLTVDLESLRPEGQIRARWALDAWSHYSGISFVETGEDADISFRGRRGDESYAKRTLERGDLEHVRIVVANDLLRDDPVFGDQGYSVLLHEVGHALGLGHPGPYNGTGVYGRDALYQNDTTLMSALSYFDPDMDFANLDVGEWGGWGEPATPMPADILALEVLYGPVRVNGGRTVYDESVFTTGILGQRLTLAEAEAYDEAFHDVLVTIKDDGGRDRIDLSAFRGPGYIDNVIDLTPGAVSTPAFYDGFRFRLHDTTVIEDFVGTRYRDDVTGNDVANVIRGMDRRDILHGAGGRDELFGNNGRDRLFGDDGRDTLKGGRHGDRLHGGRDADRLDGGGGQDRLFGGLGNDRLSGGYGDDVLIGGRGDDRLHGGRGADRFVFGKEMASDVVRDFADDLDMLDLRAFGFASRSEARSSASNVGRDVVFDFGGDDVLTVLDMTKGELRDDILV